MKQGIVPVCQHCNRPISGIPTQIAGNLYHFECTRSPYANNAWGQPSAQYVKPDWDLMVKEITKWQT